MLATCSGQTFGYLLGRNLRTYNGYHVGCLVGGEIFGADGFYLGEITQDQYLITDLSKKQKRRKPFEPFGPGISLLKEADIAPLEVGPGFADFPPATHFIWQWQEKHREQIEDLLRRYVEGDS
jgi:hypothetical protein